MKSVDCLKSLTLAVLALLAINSACEGQTLNSFCDTLKYGGNPVLSYGAPGEWDDKAMEQPYVFRFNSTHWFMFYEGYNASYPYYYKIGYAYSTDLIRWSKFSGNPVFKPREGEGAFDRSGVGGPCLIHNGTGWLMYYHGRNLTGTEEHYEIGAAYSTSPTLSKWVRLNDGKPVISLGPSGTWQEKVVAAPSVIRLPNGTYVMAYEGATVSWANFRIGLAKCDEPDGVEWTKLSNNPLIDLGPAYWDSKYVAGPHLMFDEETERYEIIYAGSSPTSTIGGASGIEFGLAYSQDLVKWSKSGWNPILSPSSAAWDSKAMNAPCVLKNGSMRYLFYCGRDNVGDGGFEVGFAFVGIPPQPSLINLVSDGSTGQVYYIYADAKHYVAGPSAFDSYGFSWSRIIVVDHKVLEAFPSGYKLDIGRQATPLPYDGKLFKDVSTGKVYYIYKGKHHCVASPSAFEAYGFAWNEVITTTDDVIQSFHKGYDLDGVNPLPRDGTLLGDGSTGCVYYIYGGMKYWVNTQIALDSYGFNRSTIQWVSASVIDSHPDGYQLDGYRPLPKKGMLLGDSLTGTVYFLYGARLYWITGSKAFTRYGFDWGDVHWLPHEVLSLYERGYSLNGIAPLPEGINY